MNYKKTLTVILTVLMAGALFALAGPAAAQDVAPDQGQGEINLTLEPSEATVAPGGEQTYDIYVDDPDEGISAYNFNISTTDQSTAEIIGHYEAAVFRFQPGQNNPLIRSNITDDGQTVAPAGYIGDGSTFQPGGDTLMLSAAMLDQSWSAQSRVWLGNVTVKAGNTAGATANLEFLPASGSAPSGQSGPSAADFESNQAGNIDAILDNNESVYTENALNNGSMTVQQQQQDPAESALSNLDIAGQGTDATITQGDDEPINVTVENVGNQSGSFEVNLSIAGGVATDSQTTATLNPGETEMVSFTGITDGLPEGNHSVDVSTDNDSASGTIEVQSAQTGQAESALSGLDIGGQGNAATITEGDDVPVNVTVENVGNASGSFTVNLDIGSGAATDSQTTGTLSPGQTETVTFTGVTDGLPTGTHAVDVSTSDDGTAGSVEVQSATQPQPESALTNLQIAGQGSSATITAGTDEAITVNVENVGNASGDFTVDLAIDGTTDSYTTDTLSEGGSETATFTGVTDGLAPGSYTVDVSTADDAATGSLQGQQPVAPSAVTTVLSARHRSAA